MKGLVIKNTGSWYTVRTDNGETVESKIKGNFRLKGIRSTNPVAVGDRVEIALNQEGTAFITAIEDRRNYIVRKSQNLSKQSHIIAANGVPYRHREPSADLHHLHRPFPRFG